MDADDRGRDDRALGSGLGLVPTCDPAWIARATLAFVAFGVLFRAVRYLLDPPLWCDETMLAANLLNRGYRDVFLHSLDYRQICPVLFLCVELTAVKCLGFTELSLRLFPFLCGASSVLLFWRMAGRVLKGEALLCAVALFAVSSWPLRYVSEVKPYASDLFVALALLSIAVEWWRRPERTAWLWALVALAPIALGLSFPAVLVAGGIGVGLLGMVWRSDRWDVRLGFLAYNLAVAVTFLSLLPFYKTAPQDHAYFHRDWAAAFPPTDGLGKFAVWFLETNTGYMFAYPDGGARGASALTSIAFAVGAVVLWRRGYRTVFALCLAPFGMALAAAAMHRYPYGVSTRTMQYAVPMICLLAGLGMATVLSSIRALKPRRRVMLSYLAALAVFGFARMGFDVSHPYRQASDEMHRGFARWFWSEKSRDAVLVCPKADFGLEFTPEHWTKDGTDTYLCYQRLYSPRHHRGESPALDAVSPARPLRFVFFNEFPESRPAFHPWLAGMLRTFDLSAVERFPIHAPPGKPNEWDSLYVLYEFVPKPPPPSGTLVGISPAGPVRR